MALPFDSNALAPAERPSTEALNRGFSASHAALDFFYRQTLAQRTSASNDRAILRDGFLGDAFCTRAVNPASMFVEVAAGLGFRYDPTDPLVAAQDSIVGVYQGVSDLSPFRPLVLPQAATLPVPAAPLVGQSRYDLIEVRPKRELAEYGNLLRFNFGTLQWAPQSAAAFLRYAIETAEVASVVSPALSTAPLSYVQGVAAPTGTQVEPPGTPGYITIARILVNGGDTSIPQNRIVDRRAYSTPTNGVTDIGGMFDIVTSGVPTDPATPTIVSLAAPPGVQFAIVGQGKGDASFALVIVTGKQAQNFTATVSPFKGLSSAGEPIVTWGYSSALTGVVGVTPFFTQARFADPAYTSPTLALADGQKFAYILFQSAAWNPGSNLFDAAMPTPTRYTFNAKLW